jgi:hypothetical protein
MGTSDNASGANNFLAPINNEPWRKEICSKCRFQERAPRDPNKPIDLKAPIILICRHSPPQIVFAIGQQSNGQPVPMPMGSMYPMIPNDYPACSKFEPI